jgi:hypothetical protein
VNSVLKSRSRRLTKKIACLCWAAYNKNPKQEEDGDTFNIETLLRALLCETVTTENRKLSMSFLCQFKYVRALLLRNPKGSRVLEEYDRYNTLCCESRQTLVKIAVAQLVEECGK